MAPIFCYLALDPMCGPQIPILLMEISMKILDKVIDKIDSL